MFIVSHYKSDYSWVRDYTEDYVVFTKERLNVGYNIYDILTFIVEEYDRLPEVCVFVKDNLMSRQPPHITRREFDRLIKRRSFTPLLTKGHKVYDPVCHYSEDGWYCELNNSWYVNQYEFRHFKSYGEFADIMGLPNPKYLKFAPGANYIVPRANILRRKRSFYRKLLSFITYAQLPGEAHVIERAFHDIWS